MPFDFSQSLALYFIFIRLDVVSLVELLRLCFCVFQSLCFCLSPDVQYRSELISIFVTHPFFLPC